MPQTLHALDYLSGKAAGDESRPPVCVVFGDEPFLKQLVIARLRSTLLDTDAPFHSFEGDAAEWRDVIDELSTVSLFGGGGPRLAVVEGADKFVSQHRSRLEEYVDRPSKQGVLILDVSKWAANTRLYKAVDKAGLQVECRVPETQVGRSKVKVLDDSRMCRWIIDWARSRHATKMAKDAAPLLLDIVGPEFGLIDQELAKLALFVESGGEITSELVRSVAGGWRTKTAWDIVDAAADGNAAEALGQLDRLLQSGQKVHGIFPQLCWSLRRFAVATRLYERGEAEGSRPKLEDVLKQAGFRTWPKEVMDKASRQMRQLGRHRAGRFFEWLLEADLAIKGTHSTDDRARFVLEHLILRMARELGPAASTRAS